MKNESKRIRTSRKRTRRMGNGCRSPVQAKIGKASQRSQSQEVCSLCIMTRSPDPLSLSGRVASLIFLMTCCWLSRGASRRETPEIEARRLISSSTLCFHDVIPRLCFIDFFQVLISFRLSGIFSTSFCGFCVPSCLRFCEFYHCFK